MYNDFTAAVIRSDGTKFLLTVFIFSIEFAFISSPVFIIFVINGLFSPALVRNRANVGCIFLLSVLVSTLLVQMASSPQPIFRMFPLSHNMYRLKEKIVLSIANESNILMIQIITNKSLI